MHHANSRALRAGVAAPNAATKNEAPVTNGGPSSKHADYLIKATNRATFNALRLRFVEHGHGPIRLADDTYLATCWGRSRAFRGLQTVQHFAKKLGVDHG